MSHLTCFKAYDIRGVVPDELDEALAYRIARAYAALFAKRAAIGRDVRPSGTSLAAALPAASSARAWTWSTSAYAVRRRFTSPRST